MTPCTWGAYDYVLKDRPARLGQAGGACPGRQAAARRAPPGRDGTRDSEERYRSLFNGSPVGVYRTGEDGRIQAANPALAELFGFQNRRTNWWG